MKAFGELNCVECGYLFNLTEDGWRVIYRRDNGTLIEQGWCGLHCFVKGYIMRIMSEIASRARSGGENAS